MPITISGRDKGRFVQMSRERPAAAGVLAGKWLEQGFTDVRIDWNGRSFELRDFRAQFVFTRHGLQPADIPAATGQTELTRVPEVN